MVDLLNAVSLLLSLALLVIIFYSVLINHWISSKTKKLNEKLVINNQLSQQLELTASALEMHEALLMIDSNKLVVKANKAYCKLTGYEEQELLGKTPNLFKNITQNLKFYAELWQTLNTSGSWSGEVIELRKNGEHLLVWLSINLIRDSQGGVELYLFHYTNFGNSQAAFRRQLQFEKTIIEVAIMMLEAEFSDFDHAIDNSLKLMGNQLGADRSYLFRISSNSLFMTNTHEWCARDIDPMIDSLQNMEIKQFQWLMNQLFSRQNVHIDDVDLMPSEASNEKKEMMRQSIQSILLIPITNGNNLTGYFGFDRVTEKRAWRNEDVVMLNLVAKIFYLAQYRYQIEEFNFQYLEKTQKLLAKNQRLLKKNSDLANGMIKTLEQERHYLSQELHDELGQQMTAIRMEAKYLEEIPALQGDQQVIKSVKLIDDLTVQMINNLRSIILRIRSATLDHFGLNAALDELIAYWLSYNKAIEMNTQLIEKIEGLDENSTLTLYRAVQESLTNISKHAQANEVNIILKQGLLNDQPVVRLTISDDGIGFQLDTINEEGIGLLGMKERIHALKGECIISFNKNGKGTCIDISVPFSRGA